MENFLEKLKRIPVSNKEFHKIPEESGIYIYWSQGKPIYIGKAVNLRKRLQSYLQNNLENKTRQMLAESLYVSYVKVVSELESLLLESELIRFYKPRYNILAKDDKHPLYIKITKEDYPRIIIARKILDKDKSFIFGPFTQSKSIYMFLRYIRKIFPFSVHKISKKPCFYSHIGLCNPCPNVINFSQNKEEKKKYRKIYLENIRNIKNILNRRFTVVLNTLHKKMDVFSKNEQYEEAKFVQEQIKIFEYITQPIIPVSTYVDNPNFLEDLRKREILDLKKTLLKYFSFKKKLSRIECFDISHISGTYATASMVTFVDGFPDKSLYRRFKIRQVKGNDDIASMKEIVKRRIKNFVNWGRPDLIIVDGGKAQVKVFWQELRIYKIPVAGLAKRFEILVIPYLIKNRLMFHLDKPKGNALNILQRIRDEAHRFAKSYHNKLVKKQLLELS